MSTQEKKIEYIPVDKLWRNRDNPRKDLGDLSELAESIKINGVLQNLTVVPRYGEVTGRPTGAYTVVIGHRRLAAAKLAGLETVPCIVSNMTRAEQIRTMLLEHMQRNDLTVYEQAQGFQLMIDWGDTVEEIAERTGFSESTVRRRVKLLDLDEEMFRKAEKRGATLMDFAALEQIKDIDVRNEVLGTIGTNNFRRALREALDDQTWDDRREQFLDKIKTFAEEDPAADAQRKKYICNYGPWTCGDVVIPDDADTVKYYYRIGRSQIDIFRDKTTADTDEEETMWAKRDAERRETERIEGLLSEINALHYRLRQGFVRDLSNAACRKAMPLVAGFLMDLLWEMTYTPSKRPHLDLHDVIRTLDIADTIIYDRDGDKEEVKAPTEVQVIREAMEQYIPEKLVLCAAWCTADHAEIGYWIKSWSRDLNRYIYLHWENKWLDRIYRLLDALGYEMSDDEQAMRDGTHEIFKEFGDQGGSD